MGLRAELFGDVDDRPRSLRAVCLGDVVCTQAEGDAGQAAMTELVTLYKATGYKPDKYLTAYSALVTEANELGAQGMVYPPTYWCQWKAIGDRARQLHAQIAVDTGQALPPAPADTSIGAGLKALATAVGVAAAIAAAKYAWEQGKRR